MSAVSGDGTPDGTQENPYINIADAFSAVEEKSANDDEAIDYVISLAEGEYVLEDTLTVNAYNKYPNAASVTLDGNGDTVIKSGTSVGEFAKVTDTEITSRVPASAKDNIYGAYVGEGIENLELTADGNVMEKAKYPNSGYLTTQDASGSSFVYDGAEKWATATDMYVYYMPNYFSYSYPATVSGTTITADGASLASEKEYYVYNLLEELDESGEYFYDKESGMVYICGNTASKYEIFNMQTGLLALSNFSNLTIRDVTFENAGDTLITLSKCENTVIKNCTIKNGSKNAVAINDGKNTGLLNCDIYDMGAGGISISGGDRQTLERGDNYINNCSIHDCQRLNRSYKALVSISGVGNSITNSDIYNSYHQAITIYGNDLRIKDNKIYNVCTETADMGAIYAEGDWTLRGTVIEHNFIENIPAKGAMGAFAIYLDNGLSGVTVKDNIFKNVVRQAVYVNGGRDNTVTNNIFVNSGNSGAVSDILNWSDGTVKDSMREKLVAVPYTSDVYGKYANLAGILEDDPTLPKYNKFTKNVLVNTEDVSSAWLNTVTISELQTEYGCEFSSYVCGTSDLTDYANDDYTLSDEKASDLGFEAFTNSFGRR